MSSWEIIVNVEMKNHINDVINIAMATNILWMEFLMSSCFSDFFCAFAWASSRQRTIPPGPIGRFHTHHRENCVMWAPSQGTSSCLPGSLCRSLDWHARAHGLFHKRRRHPRKSRWRRGSWSVLEFGVGWFNSGCNKFYFWGCAKDLMGRLVCFFHASCYNWLA